MLNGINALPENFVADANKYTENLNGILVKHCEKSFKSIAEDIKVGEEYNPSEVAHHFKFIIGLSYMQEIMENATVSLQTVKKSGDTLDQFGFICSAVFVRELQKSFMDSLKSTTDESSEQRLHKLADDLSELRFTEEGILASMNARVGFVDELKAHVLALKMFEAQEIPAEVKELF